MIIKNMSVGNGDYYKQKGSRIEMKLDGFVELTCLDCKCFNRLDARNGVVVEGCPECASENIELVQVRYLCNGTR